MSTNIKMYSDVPTRKLINKYYELIKFDTYEVVEYLDCGDFGGVFVNSDNIIDILRERKLAGNILETEELEVLLVIGDKLIDL